TILYGSLKKVFRDPTRPEAERARAAALVRYTFLTYSISSVKELMEFVVEVEGEPYDVLSEWFIASGHDAAALVDAELNKDSPARAGAAAPLARRRAQAGGTLPRLEEWARRRGPLDNSRGTKPARLWPLLQDSLDPRLHSLRSYLSQRFAVAGVKADVLLARY